MIFYFNQTAFEAYVTVTWGAGGTCTLSNGDISYVAPDTSGSYTFAVEDEGTWTATVTRDGLTFSDSTIITESGQAKSINVDCTRYLFKSGEGQLVGWTTSGYGVGLNNGTMNDTHMSATSYPPGNAGGFGTAEAIDLTDYSTLYADVKGYYYIDNSASWQYIHIRPEANGKGGSDAATFKATAAQYSTYTTHAFDISGLSGKHYIFFHCSSLYQQVVDVKNVWLEP